MSSPFDGLPREAFWRNAVIEDGAALPYRIYSRKFPISKDDAIVTAGSCFAQHIARELRIRKFNVVNAERAPAGIPKEVALQYGYGTYSARYGNIYTTAQLKQLLNEVRGRFSPAMWVWERDGRYFDGLRPGVEPGGLASIDEVVAHRAHHLSRVKRALRQADIFVFTLGLTEAWVHAESGTVFPTAPGTIASPPDVGQFEFKNFAYNEVLDDFVFVKRLLKRIRPNIRFIVTVSPVPLTATASGEHVVSATMYSKSVLRAVAGALAQENDVDYFPSYELITSHSAPAGMFESNLRSVSKLGVKRAMTSFLSAHECEEEAEIRSAKPSMTSEPISVADSAEDVICEELLSEAFAHPQS